MLRVDKVLWEDIVKLISFGTTEQFVYEIGIENAYDEETSEIARDIIDPRQLPHYETDTFDIWNTYIERILPGAYLDKIEEEINEDRACDIEDYFLYIKEKIVYFDVFEFWWFVFNDYLEKNPTEIIIDEKITLQIKNYLSYINKKTDELNNFEITDEWDKYIDFLYYPDFTECDEKTELNYSYVRSLLYRFIFSDISYEFWLNINESAQDKLDMLKTWAKNNYGDETEPFVPIITENQEA